MTLADNTHAHLLAHHRDFKKFRDQMVESHARRFDDVFWGFVTQYAPSKVARVLDFGTGPGLLLADLAQRFSDAEIVGVDAQPDMLETARERIKGNARLSLVAHDVSTGAMSAVKEKSVDVVIASMLLHELQVPVTLLDESARTLRDGGTLFISDWVRQPLRDYVDNVRPETEDAFTHFSEHCRYTPNDLIWLVEKSGFRVQESITRKNGRFVLMAATRVREETST